MKRKTIKLTKKGVVRYAVLCDRLHTISTFYNHKDAISRMEFLDEDYKGQCKHFVQKVKITPIKCQKN